MLDIKFIREHPDLIREAARKKHIYFKVEDLLGADERRRSLLKEVEEKRAVLNVKSEEVARMTDAGEKENAIGENRGLKENLRAHEEELKKAEAAFEALMFEVPNVPDPSVPEGASDGENQEIRRWAPTPSGRGPDYSVGRDKPQFDFEPKDHIALMQSIDLVDFDRGAKVSGFRGYFLKNDAVLLSLALWQWTIAELAQKGFTLLSAPALVRGANLTGTGWLPQGKEEVYRVQEDLYLAGTAEVPVMGMSAGEVFAEGDLPKKYLAFSPCFRSEAGAYGKDVKGLYRLHEFMKVEQVVLCRAEHAESVHWHEELTKNAEELMQKLQLPHRVVVNCGGDLGLGQVKKYDIETWIPSQQKYGETHSSSYFHDFQTRRLNIRYRDNEGKMRFCHSLNNTALATPRILINIIENYQQADGSVRVPAVLQKYVGKEVITKNMGGN